MPCDMRKYPDNWDEIRDEILLRAGGNPENPSVGACCEFCGVRNYSVGWRESNGEFVLVADSDSYRLARELANIENFSECECERRIVIVLTIAHLEDPNPMNCDPDNLAALCQRCHNVYDAPMRARNRRFKQYDEELIQLELPL